MSVDRDRILREAAEFLGKRPTATQDEIAAAVGVSRATLHRHFAKRGALLEALDQLAISQLREAMAISRCQEGTAAEALQRLVAACRPVSGYLRLLYIRAQDFESDQLTEGWAEIDAQLRQLFLRGQRSGEFRHDLPTLWLNQAFFSLIAGAGRSANTGRIARSDFTGMVTELLLRGARNS
ncbi:TetR/AcrR family transcriptional regulator [Mycobacterium marinum]|uniref:TetR/AcrR family transcriptional regulator n=1 Tax=Mycobacterium marinum TaxID=1781 RepID=UPI00356456C6